ncbi:MAG: iron-sulfur cluster assembly scaffold protein [Opitutales bacterium]|nr:iron-sulfur cluster assembly scaffold protein [Opitutales bacterium]
MNEDLRQVYQDIISDHFRHPRMRGWSGEGWKDVLNVNPSCGDQIRIACRLDASGRQMLEWRHQSQGCAASVASASIMCGVLNGLSPALARDRISVFLEELLNPNGEKDSDPDAFERQALLFFRKVPSRVVCVRLAWDAALRLLDMK